MVEPISNPYNNNNISSSSSLSPSPLEPHRLSEDIDSTCSTPYVSAPSSPGRGAPSGYFFSAPASPVHYIFTKTTTSLASSDSFEFEFSSRFSSTSPTGISSMSSADELFLNGQIRPMKLSSHLQRPQLLAPVIDLHDEDDSGEPNCQKNKVIRGREWRFRNPSLHRKSRSLSPLRSGELFVRKAAPETNNDSGKMGDVQSSETTPSGSSSSSRSSSSGRNSKKWIFLKDLLYRSKSEGRGNSKEKFWSTISFSQSARERKLSPSLTPSSSRDEKERTAEKSGKQQTAKKSKPANGVSKRRVPLSAHELHYTTNRAQAEEMKKKTFLPYRQGLFGCLGFSSKGYGALSGFTRTLNPVSSR